MGRRTVDSGDGTRYNKKDEIISPLEKKRKENAVMKKVISVSLALVMLLGAMAGTASAARPFPGTDLLTVEQGGEAVKEGKIDLYRVNEFGGADTFLGSYKIGENGTVTAGRLTTGLYCWIGEDGTKTCFRVTGAGFVKTVVNLAEAAADELPAEEPAILPEEGTEDGREHMTYMSGDGFQIRYNALTVESREIDDHTAEFVYLGEGDGANKVTVSWIAEKQPEEALYETTFAWGEQESILRSEGFFPGTTDKWGYWRVFTDGDLTKCAIAGEYNGGVLMFEIESVSTGDEGRDMTVSDTLAEIIDSITYFEFGEQTMYDYIPGVYAAKDESGAEYKVILNADHTGTLALQDSVGILWGSVALTAPGASYSYTVEGENLYLDLDGVWLEFAKQIAE